MPLKIPVLDRISAYPGRVKMTPVDGEENVYDMERADSPTTEGTVINKALFDNKAYTLTGDATIYVSKMGDDVNGDGSSTAPFLTVQKAIDSIPKHLGGYTVTVSIESGVYAETVTVEGFTAGTLVIGESSKTVTVNRISVINSKIVVINIATIEKVTGNTDSLLSVADGSTVRIDSDIVLNGVGGDISGVLAKDGSVVTIGATVVVTVNNCTVTVSATKCSFISLGTVTGTGNVFGLSATLGAIVSYVTDTTEKAWSNFADSGGLVLTGTNSSDLSGATIEL